MIRRFALLALPLALAACGDDEIPFINVQAVCEANEGTVRCTCPDGSLSTQQCLDDNTTLGPCECAGAGADGGVLPDGGLLPDDDADAGLDVGDDTGADVGMDAGSDTDDAGGMDDDTEDGGGINLDDLITEDACTNDADLALLNGGEINATGSAQDCGLGCLSADDPELCSVECVVEETGLSPSCAGCYGQTVACSIEFCLASCAADPSSEACTSCQAENCLDDFYTCTGIPPEEG